MNYLDILLIIFLGLSAIHGFRKGLILELATLVALVLGVWAGFYFSGLISGLIENLFDYDGKYINIISFIIIFIIVMILVQLLARMIEKAVNLVALGPLNKIAGAFFSAVKLLFILSILIYFMNRLDDRHVLIKDTTRNESMLFPFTESIAPALMPAMKAYTEGITTVKDDESGTDVSAEE